MIKEPNKDARAVLFFQEGQPNCEQSNDWMPSLNEFAHNVVEGIQNAQKSAQAQSAEEEDKPVEAQTPETPKDLGRGPAEYAKDCAPIVYFLIDRRNLEESPWMRGRTIIADHGVRHFFAEHCWSRRDEKPGLYKDSDAVLSRVKHFSIAEIEAMVRSSRRYVWLSYFAFILGSPPLTGRNRHIVDGLDFLAITVGSVLSGLYHGIFLYRLVPGCDDPREHQIAQFYRGRVDEHHRETERLRAAGLL